MNSHNKPAQKAIHANNQPLEVAFHSAPGLNKSLQAVGFEMDVAQLSRGRLKGSLQLGGSRQLPVVSIQTNQDLLLLGNRRPGVLPLSSPEVQQTIGGSTVHEIACHYGFQSRNHFARDYRNQFGESPSATLQRASAPGMSVQSVSVAQSPQMAMALR